MSKWIADMRDKIIEENDKNDKDVNKRKKDNSQGERKKIKGATQEAKRRREYRGNDHDASATAAFFTLVSPPLPRPLLPSSPR